MSLRSILQGINEAYLAVRSDENQAEAAMAKATKIQRKSSRHGTRMLSPEQVINVDGRDMVAIDDGASRRIMPFPTDQAQRE